MDEVAYDFNLKKLIGELKADEGVRSTPYKDSLGNLTIGVGHLLTPEDGTPKFWSFDKIDEVLLSDISAAVDRIKGTDWYQALDTDRRRRALINMEFNLGNRLDGFTEFLEYIRHQRWGLAALDLSGTLWHQQLPARSSRIIKMIREG